MQTKTTSYPCLPFDHVLSRLRSIHKVFSILHALAWRNRVYEILRPGAVKEVDRIPEMNSQKQSLTTRQEENVSMPLLQSPTRTSFFELVKLHLRDWIMVLVLGGAFYALHVIPPFYRFVGRYTLDDLRYPMKSSETVPFLAIPILVVGALLVAIIGYYLYKRDIRDLHYALLGVSFSLMFSGVVTNAVKDAAGRPRPDFFWRCFPDGKDIYSATGEVICTGDQAMIREGYKSFPSGHASWCFSGLGYLSLYLAGKLQVFDLQGHVGKLVIPFIPLAVAGYISISRVNDYKHHWEDVFVAAIIGMSMATLCYRQHFPSLRDVNCRDTHTQMTIRQPSSSKDSDDLSPDVHVPLDQP